MWQRGFSLFTYLGVSRENPASELQASCVPVLRHESFSLCPLLRSVQVSPADLKSCVVQEFELTLFFSFSPSLPSLYPPLLPPFCLVEFVKAADIKVIAALGDSLTVGVICCLLLPLLCRWYSVTSTKNRLALTVDSFILHTRLVLLSRRQLQSWEELKRLQWWIKTECKWDGNKL